MTDSLEGRRVLVVGASAGIGRAVAQRFVAAGASVVMAARRDDALRELTAQAGGGTPVAADLRSANDRERLVASVVDALGEIDLVVNTVGFAELRYLRDTDEQTWSDTFAINVTAHNELVKAVMPHMSEHGIVSVLSSESSHQPRHAMIPYAASKAALEASMAGWRLEQPELRFVCVVVGATFPTDFGSAFDGDVLMQTLDTWTRHGFMKTDFMATDEVAGVLVGTLAAALANPSVNIETMVLRSPSPVTGALGDALPRAD